jgi:outer membrane immunogenic protein
MKKATLILAVLCAVGALVYAGPEQYSGKEMKQVAAEAAPSCPNWTGFYVGGFGGYKYGNIDPNLTLNGDWLPDFADDVRAIESRADNDLSTSGFELGGLLGYNYQWHNWVFGGEAAGGYLWLRNSNVTGHFIVPEFGDEYHVSTSFKTHYVATIGPRVGYAFCRWLPYVTGGLALGDLDFAQEITQHGLGVPFREGGSKSETNAGWFVGGGLQYAITNHWSARVQYQYIDLGEIGFDHSTPGSGLQGAISIQSVFSGHSEVELKEHNASFAIIYEF